MLIRVYLTAFGEGAVRLVDIPNNPPNGLLNATFHWGQNDFQPQQLPSVSVGDVIELPSGELYRVAASGFKQLPDGADPLELLGFNAISEGWKRPSGWSGRNYRHNSRFRRNPWSARDVKRHNKRCANRKVCRRKWPKIANAVLRDSGDEGKAIRIANWQVNRMGLRRRNYRRNPYSYRRHNPYSYRRHNPYYYNPSDEDDIRLVSETLNNMTPCDKKDWGLARRYRHYYRNPEPVTHTICADCFEQQMGRKPRRKRSKIEGDIKVVCAWCQKVVFDPNDPD
jgi:hypothetical protein